MISDAHIHLNIADFILELNVPEEGCFVLDGGFEGFLTERETKTEAETERERETERNTSRSHSLSRSLSHSRSYSHSHSSAVADLKINCHVGCANAPRTWGKELYSAKNGEVALWRIFDWTDGICIHVNDSEELSRLQHIAFYDVKQQTWNIYSDVNESGSLESLRYPMLPLILYYLSTEHQALLIHASGVFDGTHGRLFSGFSGVGKSTMAGLWQASGAEVINDDRLMLRKLDGHWWMYNTPMYYSDVPKKAPLDFIYLPYHHPTNLYERGTGIQTSMRFMAHCIQHGYSEKQVQWHLDQVMDITKNIPITRLGVVPTMEILTFIKGHESA
jgi:hypothetical protein